MVDPTMRAVAFTGAGGPESVTFAEVPTPRPRPGELLVEVHAAGLNRADLLQRDGEYQVPEGQSSIPGVEVAGTVAELGGGVTGFAVGDRVFGVVEGGGFAGYCRLDAGMANPVPARWDFPEAAATAECGLTANETLFTLGGLTTGQRVLVHAAASGVGTTMVRMARHVGATVYAVVGSAAKAAAVTALGAAATLDRHTVDLPAEVRKLTDGDGVDLVMDFVGGARFADNLAVLRTGGRLVVVGLLDGLDARIDLLDLVERRLEIKGSSLRLRPMTEKRGVNERFRQRWLAPLTEGRLRPVVHAVHPFADVHAAMREMAEDRNIGKIVLQLRA